MKTVFRVSAVTSLRARVVGAVVLTILLFMTSFVFGDQLDFYQVNYSIDGQSYPDTEWGRVDFTFAGQLSIMYFNLTVDGNWVIENIPVLSSRGVGIDQTVSYYFDLGSSRGDDVTTLNYVYEFIPYTLSSQPTGTATAAAVGDSNFSLYYQTKGVTGGSMPAPEQAKKLKGGEAAEPAKHSHDPNKFPNQQSDPNKCTPTAVSNSLNFLNDKHGLCIDPNRITPEAMEEATGATGEGGAGADWGKLKDEYMKKNGIPISTRIITDMSELGKEIDDGQDVEISYTWVAPNPADPNKDIKGGHTVAVVGITETKDANGNSTGYAVDVVDDSDQDDPNGGCGPPRTITFDPNGALSGGEPGVTGGTFDFAVVECPEPDWCGKANVALRWEFDDNGNPIPDTNSPWDKGTGSVKVDSNGTSTEYDFNINNDANENGIKHVWLSYSYVTNGDRSGDIAGPTTKGYHNSTGEWDLKSYTIKQRMGDIIEVTIIWIITPQPGEEDFKLLLFGNWMLKDIKILTYCVPAPPPLTPCEKAISNGTNFPGDLNADCSVDFHDFSLLAGDWLETIAVFTE